MIRKSEATETGEERKYVSAYLADDVVEQVEENISKTIEKVRKKLPQTFGTTSVSGITVSSDESRSTVYEIL